MDDFIKLPRLYVDHQLREGQSFDFTPDQAHYLRAVLRRNPGDEVRVFNGQDGEWICSLGEVGKKGASAIPTRQIATQPAAPAPLHLYFAPIKKSRLDFLIEKAVELGATHLHPVLTQNTENRHSNEDRLRAQIAEAAEQSERLDMPYLAPAQNLAAILTNPAAPLYACVERAWDAPLLAAALQPGPAALLIGPEGGFTAAETAQIRQAPAIRVASLGPLTLRTETAVCAALIAVQNYRLA